MRSSIARAAGAAAAAPWPPPVAGDGDAVRCSEALGRVAVGGGEASGRLVWQLAQADHDRARLLRRGGGEGRAPAIGCARRRIPVVGTAAAGAALGAALRAITHAAEALLRQVPLEATTGLPGEARSRAVSASQLPPQGAHCGLELLHLISQL
eukprot:scaffold70215_cov65-Phaeocystis_antarctica.AAC.6